MPLKRKEKKSGNALVSLPSAFERGYISHIYTNNLACDVITISNKILRGLALPNSIQFPNSQCAHIELPELGTPVLVYTGTSKPQIISYCPTAGVGTETANDAIEANFRTNVSEELLPGDWFHKGDKGQHIGIFGPGIIKLHSGLDSTQFVVSQDDELVGINCRNFSLTTAGGKLEVNDNTGKQELQFKFGTDSLTETFDENWRFWLSLTSLGTSFRILDSVGNTTYENTIDMSGNIKHTTVGKITQQSGDKSENINGTYHLTTTENTVWNANGLQINNTGRTTLNTNALQLNTTSTLALFANRDVQLSSGRTITISAPGPTPYIPGSATAKIDIGNGSFIVDVGKIMMGPLSNIELNTYAPGSNVKLFSALGKILLETTLPDSVILGSVGGVGISHVVKWELGLQEFLKALITWLDTHIHLGGTGPTGNTAPPLVPSSTTLSGLLSIIPSMKVQVGM